MTGVRVSLTTFADFTGARGPERARIAARLREMYEDRSRRGWNYYREFDAAFVGGLRDGDLDARLDRVVTEAVLPGQARHFAELAEGARTLVSRIGAVRVLPCSPRTWTHGELTLSVSPQVAVELRDGTQEVWFLYHKERRLEQGTADAALFVLGEVIRESGTSAVPRVVDVRAGRRFGLGRNRNRSRLSTFVTEEADELVR